MNGPKIAAIAAGVLVAIQLVPIRPTNPPVESEVPAPAAVREVLRQSCYDCHSHESKWPWYAQVAPVSWWIAYHVHEARENVDFSAWNRYDAEKQAKIIHEVWEEVEEGKMPLPSYLPMHPQARLTDEDRAALREWSVIAGGGEEEGSDE